MMQSPDTYLHKLVYDVSSVALILNNGFNNTINGNPMFY